MKHLKMYIITLVSLLVCTTTLAKEPINSENEAKLEIRIAKATGGIIGDKIGKRVDLALTNITGTIYDGDLARYTFKYAGESGAEVGMQSFIEKCGTVQYNVCIRVPTVTNDVIWSIQRAQPVPFRETWLGSWFK